jgi:hypothetical protein
MQMKQCFMNRMLFADNPAGRRTSYILEELCYRLTDDVYLVYVRCLLEMKPRRIFFQTY